MTFLWQPIKEPALLARINDLHREVVDRLVERREKLGREGKRPMTRGRTFHLDEAGRPEWHAYDGDLSRHLFYFEDPDDNSKNGWMIAMFDELSCTYACLYSELEFPIGVWIQMTGDML
jgi:hypothetical protein